MSAIADEAIPSAGSSPADQAAQPVRRRPGYGSEARRHLEAGRPIYYMEPNTPKGLVIREYPDGRREFVRLDQNGAIEVVEPI